MSIIYILFGGIAQLGERLHGMQEVSGSIPLISTKTMLLDPTSPSSRGLGHDPFTVVTGVRIPLGTPSFAWHHGSKLRCKKALLCGAFSFLGTEFVCSFRRISGALHHVK